MSEKAFGALPDGFTIKDYWAEKFFDMAISHHPEAEDSPDIGYAMAKSAYDVAEDLMYYRLYGLDRRKKV